MNKCDTIFTNNGQFSFTKNLLHPELYTINCIKTKQSITAIKEGNERKIRSIEDITNRELFLESGEATITTRFSEFGTAQVLRAQHNAQDKYTEFRKRFNPLVKVARTIIDSSSAPKRTEQEKMLCRNLLERVNQIENEVAEKFTTENTDNAVGAYVLYRFCRTENYQKLDSLYNLFSPGLQASEYLKNVKDKIKALSGLKIGRQVTVFTAETSTGKTISLSDFKGKYVVLDFWGTWCMPCISGFPKMKEYYSRYGEKLEIIGVACRNKEIDWMNSIKKHNINWLHVLNHEGSNDLTVKYSVAAYPTKILIDQSGNLVQVFTGESEDFYKKLDSLFGNR
jgi:thiol-disulfide isomerase/thioredoxin